MNALVDFHRRLRSQIGLATLLLQFLFSTSLAEAQLFSAEDRKAGLELISDDSRPTGWVYINVCGPGPAGEEEMHAAINAHRFEEIRLIPARISYFSPELFDQCSRDAIHGAAYANSSAGADLNVLADAVDELLMLFDTSGWSLEIPATDEVLSGDPYQIQLWVPARQAWQTASQDSTASADTSPLPPVASQMCVQWLLQGSARQFCRMQEFRLECESQQRQDAGHIGLLAQAIGTAASCFETCGSSICQTDSIQVQGDETDDWPEGFLSDPGNWEQIISFNFRGMEARCHLMLHRNGEFSSAFASCDQY